MEDERNRVRAFRLKQNVSWKWAGGTVEGVVVKIFRERVERKIKGAKIVRNGSKENPAYLVRSNKGNFALKLHSELSGAPSRVGKSSLVRSLLNH